MFAIINNDTIIASCETQTDVDLYLQDYPNATYHQVPDDFKVYEYKVLNGVPVKKTTSDLYNESLINEIILQRKMSYPPITDYLDGIVKGDQAQIDKYIADCLAVKAKYPKPE